MNAPDDSKASVDAWLDDLLIAVEKRGGFSLDTQDKLPISETMSVQEAKAAIKSHLQEREAAAGFEGRIAELEWLNGLFDDELRDYVTKRLKALQVELLAVGEGRG